MQWCGQVIAFTVRRLLAARDIDARGVDCTGVRLAHHQFRQVKRRRVGHDQQVFVFTQP